MNEILEEIRARSSGADTRPLDLEGADLSKQDLVGANLAGLDLSRANLSNANLTKASLRGAKLAGADLRNAELTGADLREATLDEADASHAGLGRADLRGARLFDANLEGATLSMSDLGRADLRCARLRNARLREANLSHTDFTSADLEHADLSLSTVSGAVFNNADLRQARLRAIRDFQSAQWHGVDIRDVNFAGAYRLRRFIIDQNYIKELRDGGRSQRLIYTLWWLTSDCGRSSLRWSACIALCVFFYAWIFSFVDVNHGNQPASWLTSVYYSVVTLTTLGYGDIVPASAAAKVVVILEVITGYVMLGGLLSIFANKLARRGD